MNKKNSISLSIVLLSPFLNLYAQEYKIEDRLVINGFSHHLNKPPTPIKKWNENNYGLSLNRSYQRVGEDNRYALEIGYFKESFGKDDFYAAGSWMKDLTQEPRISLGAMAGLSYRTVGLKNNTSITPIFQEKKINVIAGAVAQLEIPHTPIVIQTTFIPKIKEISPGVFFMQVMVKF